MNVNHGTTGEVAMNPLGTRLMQISFKRLPDEHADLMIRAGNYFLNTRTNRPALPYLAGAIIFGVVCGVGLELYRQFLLAPYFGIEKLPDFGVIVMEMLPVLLAIAIGAALQRYLTVRARRKALIARLDKEVMIDIDVFEKGMEINRDGQFISYEWTAFKKVETANGYLVLRQDDSILSIPARAFKDKDAYLTDSHEIVALWKEANKAKLEDLAAARKAAALDLQTKKGQEAASLKIPGSSPASRKVGSRERQKK
jgi:hypothetical protein